MTSHSFYLLMNGLFFDSSIELLMFDPKYVQEIENSSFNNFYLII